MSNNLTFQSNDWAAVEELSKEQIIEEVAQELSRTHPELFSRGGEIGDNIDMMRTLIDKSVLLRKDLAPPELKEVTDSILGQSTGYGPLLEFFLPEAKEITETFINPSREGPKVFYGKRGRTWPAPKQYFKNNEEVENYLQKICESVGRPFNTTSSIVDAWLPDGTRVAAVGFKTSPLGPMATLRKSPLIRPPMYLHKLVEFEMLPPFAADLLVDLAVRGHANIGVFGRTDSGKTTFLQALTYYIDLIERVFVSETSFEMFLPHLPNCINLVEVVYGNEVIVDMTQLLKTMNRNNPDRGIVGEIRSKEIIAASQMAASVGGGFWTGGHARGIDDLRLRVFGMFLDGGIQLPRDFLDETIRSMFDFIVFLGKDGLQSEDERKRTLLSIIEVTPKNEKSDGYREIISFDYDEFVASNGKNRRWLYKNAVTPKRLSELAYNGAIIRPEYQEVTPQYKYLYPGKEIRNKCIC